MTPGVLRLVAPGYYGSTPVRQRVTEFGRSVRRLTPTPPLRPPERPHGPSLSDVWRAWEDADLWSCTYCDAPFGGLVVGEADHVVALSAGGAHDLHNLVPSCRTCNRSKDAHPVQRWLAELTGQD